MDYSSDPTSRPRLIVFTRYPEPGKVKTRLIPAIGAEGAAELHRRLTVHALGQADLLAVRRSVQTEVRFTGGSVEAMRQAFGPRRYREQGDGDLGRRLHRAAADAFDEGCRRVVVIGTDCPHLTASILDVAFCELDSRELVLGPAADGGYYLIGMSRLLPEMFEGIPWSTDGALTATLQVAQRLRLNVARLATLSDIDTPDDLKTAHHFPV